VSEKDLPYEWLFLNRYLQLDPVIGRVDQILLRPEIAFSSLHRRMARQQLNLFQFPAGRPTQLGCSATQIMRRDPGNSDSRGIRSE
jgi:hypothetical protein